MTFEPTLPAAHIRAALRVRRIGRHVVSLAETPSTNDLCWQRLAQGPDADGWVVLTDYQTAGRGRFHRTWLAPRASSVLASALLVQPAEPLLLERLGLIAGIAACEAARRVSGADIEMRWPNDLVCRGRKIGGVLVEARQVDAARMAAVIGIGINCLQHAAHFPPALRLKAASLDMVSTQAISRLDLAVELIARLDAWLAGPIPPAERVRQVWMSLAEPTGRRVCLIHGGQRLYGRTVELDPTGGLLVELEAGGRRIFDPAKTSLEPAE